MSNSDNPGNGAAFQKQVFGWFENHYQKSFILEKKIPIGKPAKDHKFDIVDEAGTIAIECKRYTWTESGNVPSAKGSYLRIIQDYLNAEGLLYETNLPERIKKRKAGKKYAIQEHVRGIIYAFLSSQTKWHRIEPHLGEIDKLFFNYDIGKILAHSPAYFYDSLYSLKCGNISTKAQMESLPDIIHLLQRIENEYGSIDSFITSDTPDVIVEKLSKGSSPYKVKMLGEALAWEYLRNVGIDGAKPDTHLRRFLGADRMGTGDNSPATAGEVNEQVTQLSEQTGMYKGEIDNLIWSFCADGYGEICTAIPHCGKCPIADYCNSSN